MPDTTEQKPGEAANAVRVVQRSFVMENFCGLHARPAHLLIKCVSQFRSGVMVQCGKELSDAGSLLGLLGLAAGWQSKMTFTATGTDAGPTITAIGRLFDRRFDEAYEKPVAAPSGNASDSRP